MLFELKRIVEKFKEYQSIGVKCVLASVVDLDGSSYRKPGVRMLISSSGEIIGALSGGCVEKEVKRLAETVFDTNVPLMMTYDGRYKLGCEGILYILIEPLELSKDFLQAWDAQLKQRKSITIKSNFKREVDSSNGFGSIIKLEQGEFSCRKDFVLNETHEVFEDRLEPTTRLLIIGAEHDAHYMHKAAVFMGLDVEIVSSTSNSVSNVDFPEARQIHLIEPEQVVNLNIESDTAIILMTHNYSKDLLFTKYLLSIDCKYFGIIGSRSRKNKLFEDLIEQNMDLDLEKLELISSPAGLNIGAITPQEIAISVIGEIIQKIRS